MKNPEIDILRKIFTVFSIGYQFENDPCNQVLRIFNNNAKSPVVPAQNPVNQLFVCRIISNGIVHLMDETGKLE